MNTPAHLVVNLALLAGGERRPHARAVAFGAVLPDLPMFGFFFWERFVAGHPQRVIWGERYFDADWQLFFDLFNSIPVALLVAGMAYAFGRSAWLWGGLSVALHGLLDLPVHREDGHRHFLPLTHWKFESPVSYWDPNHHGAWGAGVETLLLLGAVAVLWPRTTPWGWRAALAGVAALSVVVWVLFYGLGLAPG